MDFTNFFLLFTLEVWKCLSGFNHKPYLLLNPKSLFNSYDSKALLFKSVLLIDIYTFEQTTPAETRPLAHMRVHMDLFEISRRFIVHLYTLYNFQTCSGINTKFSGNYKTSTIKTYMKFFCNNLEYKNIHKNNHKESKVRHPMCNLMHVCYRRT